MTRGVIYWVAAGSYGSVTFNTPDSGTSPITIRAATAASNGSASDWNNNFAGQAVFSAAGYWYVFPYRLLEY